MLFLLFSRDYHGDKLELFNFFYVKLLSQKISALSYNAKYFYSRHNKKKVEYLAQVTEQVRVNY